MKAVTNYIKEIAQKYERGNATEHTYRDSLIALSKALIPVAFELTNEPKRQACGAPDFILQRGDIPIGYIEAKDISTPLDRTEKGEQMGRYLHALDNLILTDFCEFRFYRNGDLVGSSQIARSFGGKIKPLPANIDQFVALYLAFSAYKASTITNPKQLAVMMAKRATLVKDVFTNILNSKDHSGLHDQFDAFKSVLLHDVTGEEFADIYAETLAYGLFTARLHDKSPDTFSREEAYRLIPRSNPFLRELFTYVGTKLDDRAEWIVDELCDVFRATDIKTMVANFNRGTGRDDPFIHFYETFIAAYNPRKREARGVWYTPEPVVQFIVRAVDAILVKHFRLPKGLADTSETTIQVEMPRDDRRSKRSTVPVSRKVHKVQILDVATGTGTFLAEVVDRIHARFKGQEGLWSRYVEEHLIPRLYGFELLMASYAMCHMKLELMLEETGYRPKSAQQPRLNVYLTNSLHPAHEEVDKLPLVEWFSRESNEASYIKRYSPIMVAIGNPPYRGISSNRGKLIVNIDDYKYVDGVHFGERKHWLHDDYVKFMRLGEHFIEKNGQGILGYVTNHGYLDNPTFRGMRWHLMRSFSEIYVLDLHGNSNKQERAPNGDADTNVFDIQQGVSIILAFRKPDKPKKHLATVFHAELWGSRESKYEFLRETKFDDVSWSKVSSEEPFYYFVPRQSDAEGQYSAGFALDELFSASGAGVVSARDEFVMAFDDNELFNRMARAAKMKIEDAREEFSLRADVESWRVEWAISDLKATGPSKSNISPILYRPFDVRQIYYTSKSGGILARPNFRIMQHMNSGENVALICPKQSHGSLGAFVTSGLAAHKAFDAYNINTLFPLYIMPMAGLKGKAVPNFADKIWSKIKRVGGKLAEDPQAVFDYIYAVLHSRTYNTKYGEYLKSGYPRVPYPLSSAAFRRFSKLGGQLREAHMLQGKCSTPDGKLARYPIDGSDRVEFAKFAANRVWINDEQYFDNVPASVWTLRIGGYVPARKWLQDRIGRDLPMSELEHYQRLIAALIENERLLDLIEATFVADE